jgi:hypothetical protein
MTNDMFVQHLEEHCIMFDRRPVFQSGVDMGIRCYNKNTSKTGFHYGCGATHKEAVQDWIDKAKWK